MDKKLTGYYILSAALIMMISVAILAARSYFTSTSPAVEAAPARSGETTTKPWLGQKEYPNFITGKMESGDIRFELRPEGSDDGRFILRYFANSHDLVLEGYNLMEMVSLETGAGAVRPASATPMKGHHSSGLITFNIEPSRGPLTVNISGLPRDLVRTYRWPGGFDSSGSGKR
jgi:hypothetical protein